MDVPTDPKCDAQSACRRQGKQCGRCDIADALCAAPDVSERLRLSVGRGRTVSSSAKHCPGTPPISSPPSCLTPANATGQPWAPRHIRCVTLAETGWALWAGWSTLLCIRNGKLTSRTRLDDVDEYSALRALHTPHGGRCDTVRCRGGGSTVGCCGVSAAQDLSAKAGGKATILPLRQVPAKHGGGGVSLAISSACQLTACHLSRLRAAHSDHDGARGCSDRQLTVTAPWSWLIPTAEDGPLVCWRGSRRTKPRQHQHHRRRRRRRHCVLTTVSSFHCRRCEPRSRR